MCKIKVLQIQGVGVFRYTMWKCDLQTHLYHTCRPKSRSQKSPAELNKTNNIMRMQEHSCNQLPKIQNEFIPHVSDINFRKTSVKRFNVESIKLCSYTHMFVLVWGKHKHEHVILHITK